MNPIKIHTGVSRVFLVTACCIALCGCSRPASIKVLIKMIDKQEAYFSQRIAAPFALDQNAQVAVEHYNNTDSLEYYLENNSGQVGIVKVPFDKASVLINKKLLLPLDSVCTPLQMEEYKKTYLLTGLAQRDGQYYLIPRKFETRIMVFSKSKVSDALERWRKNKDSIDVSLKKINGYGLPATYILESDPDKWNFYDIYVLGWIWAHTPYDGVVCPRVANRGKRYAGTSLGVIDRVFQCNGDNDVVLSMDGIPVADAFHWETVYAADGIYNPKMWTEGWGGAEIWKGFNNGTVFLSFMTQLDCFFIHGTGQDGLDGYLKNPDDMGVTIMPQGCSVQLDDHGTLRRKGTRSITTGGWWWGIPASTPNPALSYKLAQYITSTTVQIQESTRFGMIPVRKDILSDLSMLFGGGWISEVYQISLRQLMENKYTTIPHDAAFNQIASIYLDGWYDMVVNQNFSKNRTTPDFDYITSVLQKTYVPKAAQVRSFSGRIP